MADTSGSIKGSEVYTSLPNVFNIYLLPAFYTTEKGIILEKCLMNWLIDWLYSVIRRIGNI